MAVLTPKRRQGLPQGAFALPKDRAYPIYDVTHARVALAYGSRYASPAKLEQIKAAVRKKYPKMKVS
jgi:hypothetical protein